MVIKFCCHKNDLYPQGREDNNIAVHSVHQGNVKQLLMHLTWAFLAASELSGGSQAHSSPSTTLARQSQVALAVEAELDESSGVHASDLAPETSQLILSNAQLRSNTR